MNFIKKLIKTRKFTIIDIWSYKVKVGIFEQKDAKIILLGYWEKRQEVTDIIHWEIWNISWVCETINDAILKAVRESWVNPKDIIINIPSSIIVSESNKINYKRNHKNEEIDMRELDYIIWKVEARAIEKVKDKIEKTTGYSDVDMKLITSSINKISIDWNVVSNPIWFTWENIRIQVLNIFIPLSKYNTIQSIWNYLNKNVLSIVPLEFSVPKILENSDFAFDDIVFIDLWSIRTRITVQKQWSIIWFDRLNIWINDLIKNISEKFKISKEEVIGKINNEKFEELRKEFLDTWIDWVFIILKEIIADDIMPHNIFLIWWWDNDFLREYLKSLDLKKFDFKTIKNFNFIDFDYDSILEIKTETWFKNKTNLNMLSMALAWKNIINLNKDPVIEALKNIVWKLDI